MVRLIGVRTGTGDSLYSYTGSEVPSGTSAGRNGAAGGVAATGKVASRGFTLICPVLGGGNVYVPIVMRGAGGSGPGPDVVSNASGMTFQRDAGPECEVVVAAVLIGWFEGAGICHPEAASFGLARARPCGQSE